MNVDQISALDDEPVPQAVSNVKFSYAVNSVRVVSVDGLTNAVKEVGVTVSGVDGAAKFELPVTVILGAADPKSFIAFENLTEAQIVSWVENDPSLDSTKAHIAYVVAKEVERASLEQKPLPWAPTPEAPAAAADAAA